MPCIIFFVTRFLFSSASFGSAAIRLFRSLIYIRCSIFRRWWSPGGWSVYGSLCKSNLSIKRSRPVHGSKEMMFGTTLLHRTVIGSFGPEISIWNFICTQYLNIQFIAAKRKIDCRLRSLSIKNKGSRGSLVDLMKSCAEVSAAAGLAGMSSAAEPAVPLRLSLHRSSMRYPQYPDAPRYISW